MGNVELTVIVAESSLRTGRAKPEKPSCKTTWGTSMKSSAPFLSITRSDG